MAHSQDIKKRIRTIRSIAKITKAMKMVAASRLRRYQAQLHQGQAYMAELMNMMGVLQEKSTSINLSPSPSTGLLTSRPVHTQWLIVFSSDRGLCGSFNSVLFRAIEKRYASSSNVELCLIGKKAIRFFGRRDFVVHRNLTNFWQDFQYGPVAEFSDYLTDAFLTGKVDQVDILYNHFESIMRQIVTQETLLPFVDPYSSKNTCPECDQVLWEPNFQSTRQWLLTTFMKTKLYLCGLHSMTSEYGARMTAMDSATRNAMDMMDELTLNMNRCRQAAITNDLVEIISGAHAIQ